MNPLPIVAAASFETPAGAQPLPLRTELKRVCANPPRRINRLIELSLIGAHRCVGGRALHPDTPIYMAFASGCIADSVGMVRDATRGQPPMPVTFINVSSNMAGFYVASSLGLHSGNQVVSARGFPWEAMLELALLGGAKDRGLLMGAVEECAWPLPEHRERLGLPEDCKLLETSHWLLADREAKAPMALLHDVRQFADDAALRAYIGARRWPEGSELSADGFAGDELAALAQSAGLQLHAGLAEDTYAGLPAALACCRFVEQVRGCTLLHVTRARHGAWAAVHLETR